MAVLTQPITGAVCWVELGTTDAPAAKKFYGSLFGWSYEDVPMGDQGVYSLGKHEKGSVSGTYTLTPEMQKIGVPPHWLTYFASENIDASAKRVTELGGTVLKPPFDVMTIGRMAVVQDPTGGSFAFWKANNPTPWPSDEKNAFGWAQLNCADPAKAASFYVKLFGWTTRRDPMPQGGEYTTCQLGEAPVAGIMPKPPGSEGSPSHWLVYFLVDDVEAAFARAASLGAKTFVPPTLIPQMVRFVVMADPQGAAFGLMSKA